MTPIAQVLAGVLAHPAPLLILDTCNFLDLFRRDDTKHSSRVRPTEILAAVQLLQLRQQLPNAVHLIVPELIPTEYADHASKIVGVIEGWVEFHDRNQEWLAETAKALAIPMPPPTAVRQFGLPAGCRKLADELLTSAVVLARDPGCLDRAVARLVNKRRPSHKKEMKDSMNLEQSLELCRALTAAGFTRGKVFVSSNVNDFAGGASNPSLHTDLRNEFAAVGLDYFTSLEAAIRELRLKNKSDRTHFSHFYASGGQPSGNSPYTAWYALTVAGGGSVSAAATLSR